MEKSVCPHCGKELPNPEKLPWHLSRECPAFASEREASAGESEREKSNQQER